MRLASYFNNWRAPLPSYKRVEEGEVQDGDFVLDLGGDLIDYRGPITPHMRVYRPVYTHAWRPIDAS